MTSERDIHDLMTQGVCVITGGGSGMGLATARLMGDYHVVVAGRTAAKRDAAVNELAKASITASAFVCDVADAHAVRSLAAYAAGIGPVRAVIHAAGLSPHLASVDTIVRVNALGSLHVNDVFLDVVEPGGCVVDVSSMSAHLVPRMVLPRRLYAGAGTNFWVREENRSAQDSLANTKSHLRGP